MKNLKNIRCFKAAPYLKSYRAYYDLANGQRHLIGCFATIKEAVCARNFFEISLLSSGSLCGALKSITQHHDKTLWQLSYAQTSFG
ncbi:MAG: hypothetical protein KZQ83_04275 [gamma proteobacterium symbiont of Taylorina sp.]|nr:hypothetical protein [gamma proteobacterium symbiont of Taylorina sp.]